MRAYAHCEYSNGYIVFDRFTSEKEIWRLSSIDDVSPDSSSSLPDITQTQISPDGSQPGLFKPHALLQTPEPTRAYRFVHPTLLVAAFERVYLWDVPSACLVQIIENIQPLTEGGLGDNNISLGTLNYVELSERHVFLCGGHALRAFERGTGRAVLTIPSNKFMYGRWGYKLKSGPRNECMMESVIVEHEMEAIMRGPGGGGQRQYLDEFVAGSYFFVPSFNVSLTDGLAHVSSCGSLLVGLLSSSRLIVMPHFERAIHDQLLNIFDWTLDVQLGAPHAQSVYLAFEDNRVAVVTVRFVHISTLLLPTHQMKQGSALFLVHLPPFSSDFMTAATPPPIQVFRIPFFLDPQQLCSVSCLQMSDTGLYLTWKPSYVDNVDDDEEEEEEVDNEADDDPEMQENMFWESIADQAPTYVGKNLLRLFACYTGTYVYGILVLQNGDYMVVTNERTFLSFPCGGRAWF